MSGRTAASVGRLQQRTGDGHTPSAPSPFIIPHVFSPFASRRLVSHASELCLVFLGGRSQWPCADRPSPSSFSGRWRRPGGVGRVWAWTLRTYCSAAATKESYSTAKTTYFDENLQFSLEAIWEVTVETRAPWQR